jgi:AdoMet-dependent heme synthase
VTSPYSPPRLIFWETTAGCNLACTHCRRITVADQLTPQDLTTEDARRFIDQISAFARPVLVLSGGEPLMRPDIFTIARYATTAGLMVALATNGTMIDAATAIAIKESGVRRVSISFDGADGPTHDILRGAGAFERALAGTAALRDAGVPFQFNTTVARHNAEQMDEMLTLATDLGAVGLHLFLLVPVGCGAEISDEEQLSPAAYESILQWLYDAERASDLQLKATCAPHYFRVVRQRQAEERRAGATAAQSPSQMRQHNAGHPGAHGGTHPGSNSMHTMTRGCLAGTGVCFVSHRGEVFPCGYLPVSTGNVQMTPLQDIWETAPLFAELRDITKLKGNCGVCEFNRVCGGCRARAYGMTGDYLDEEPFCTYVPGTTPAARR